MIDLSEPSVGDCPWLYSAYWGTNVDMGIAMATVILDRFVDVYFSGSIGRARCWVVSLAQGSERNTVGIMSEYILVHIFIGWGDSMARAVAVSLLYFVITLLVVAAWGIWPFLRGDFHLGSLKRSAIPPLAERVVSS